VREFAGELRWDAPAGGADSDGGFALGQVRDRLMEFRACWLPMGVAVEDAVGFEVPGGDEEKEHDAGCPVEDLHGEGGGEGWVGFRRGLAKEQAADDADACRESEETEGVDDSVVQRGARVEDLEGSGHKECGVEKSIEGEQAEE
jgi:hypothetical protein